MMQTTKMTRIALFTGVATAALLQPAMALDAQAFVDRIIEVYGPIGYDLTFGEATLDGDTITVDGGTVAIVGMEASPTPMSFDTEITFSGVTELPDGGYMADSVTIPDIDTDFASDPVGHVTLSDMVLNDFFLPAGDTISADLILQFVGSLSTGPLSVTRAGEEVFSITSMEAANTFNPEQGSTALVDIDSTLAINGISVDLSSVEQEDPQSFAAIQALGLETIEGDITQTMNWTMADGHLVIDQFLFDFADIGAIDMTLDMLGFTPALLDKMYASNAAIAAQGLDPASEEAQNAQMMMGMEMLQGLTLVSTDIRYDDASLAGRLLDFFAEAQGVDAAAFAESLKQMVPAVLPPGVAEVFAAPVAAFLDDPKSIEIAAQPASPATLLVLTAAAANPAGLVSALGLTVTANEAAE